MLKLHSCLILAEKLISTEWNSQLPVTPDQGGSESFDPQLYLDLLTRRTNWFSHEHFQGNKNVNFTEGRC